MPRNFFSSNPIPAKAKKLGLLSIYKFSLAGPYLVVSKGAKTFTNQVDHRQEIV
jgi:hypothetical protein